MEAEVVYKLYQTLSMNSIKLAPVNSWFGFLELNFYVSLAQLRIKSQNNVQKNQNVFSTNGIIWHLLKTSTFFFGNNS